MLRYPRRGQNQPEKALFSTEKGPDLEWKDDMSERRKPLITLLLREHEDENRVKIEVFDAAQWANHRQFSLLTHHIEAGHAFFPVTGPVPTTPRLRRVVGPLYRMRINGIWYPEAEGKVFVTRKEINRYLTTLLEDALYVPIDVD